VLPSVAITVIIKNIKRKKCEGGGEEVKKKRSDGCRFHLLSGENARAAVSRTDAMASHLMLSSQRFIPTIPYPIGHNLKTHLKIILIILFCSFCYFINTK
jgi:hypothetical protein